MFFLFVRARNRIIKEMGEIAYNQFLKQTNRYDKKVKIKKLNLPISRSRTRACEVHPVGGELLPNNFSTIGTVVIAVI